MRSNFNKNNYQELNGPNIPLSNRNNVNIIKQINSHTNSNKNINKFSHYSNSNSYKDKANNKITKIIYSSNNHNHNYTHNYNNKNSNLNFNYNNSFLKEKPDMNYNKFRKSKTSDKTNNHVLNGYNKQNQNNKNKKVIIKQNSDNIKNYNYNLTMNKNSKYDNSVFNQVLKYYTVKSESKTLQIEDLSSYLSPIKNILGIQSQQNTSNSINVNKNYEFNDYNKDDDNFDDDIKFKDNINFNSNNEKENLLELDNYQNNINNNNQNLVKNSVLNNNLFHSQRNTRHSSSPFNIQIKQISNINDKNKQTNSNNNINNLREVSEIDTQISTNNNINHDLNNQQQEYNQFRTRKMSLPKGGINLGAIQLKNKILLNILHKRKQNK